MNSTVINRFRWFWAWQDDKEEAWLESMSQEGWHLEAVQIPCTYTFRLGESRRYTYRLDYMTMKKNQFLDYIQIFQDAGWEYIGEMTNWRYWRKLATAGEKPEIFTDAESKLKKYIRLINVMGFWLVLLVMLGFGIMFRRPWYDPGQSTWITVIYVIGRILYAVLIPMYVFLVIKIAIRINQLKKKRL